ncbi:hypothetical protein BGX28_001771 [Mortierella sp. GBA30]|nr:hypothetical protein BGX28_001771 [Mortierella sp. GBA30]
MTGVFQYAAFWISKRGGGGGQRIFLSFFLLSSIMSGLTSNDVVVLTMTPFLVYYSHAVELITPVAFFMAEIQTANIACYVMLRIAFRHEKYIPKDLKSPDVDPRSCLVDPFGAVFGLAILSCSLICLIGTSFAHVSVWIVTGPFALITLARDIWYDWNGKFKGPQAASLVERQDQLDINAECVENRMELGLPEIAVPEHSIVHPLSLFDNDEETEEEDAVQNSTTSTQQSMNEKEYEDNSSLENSIAGYLIAIPPASIKADEMDTLSPPVEASAVTTSTIATTNRTDNHHDKAKKPISAFERRFPLLHAITIRMPWAILPFTFSMFIMVEGLSDAGWIAVFANWATKLVPNYIAATYAIGFVSVLLCNIFNNVPMTILVARILQHPNFINSPHATPEVVKGCLFALIVGSNLGACTTLISSLAGLMWDSVLRSKNSGVGFWNFFRWNMAVMPTVIFVALSVIVIELTVVF